MTKAPSYVKSAGASLLLHQKSNEIRFVADSMLGSIARKLRIFGFDTLYVAHVDDSEVLKIGAEQDRIILTADKELFKRVVKINAKGVLVAGSDEFEDLVHILTKTGIRSIDWIDDDSRCSICNGQLEAETAKEVLARLPTNITKHHNYFFRCISCGKMYWEGSHIKRIKLLAANMNSRLEKQQNLRPEAAHRYRESRSDLKPARLV